MIHAGNHTAIDDGNERGACAGVTSRPTYTSSRITGDGGESLTTRAPVATWLVGAHLFTRTVSRRALVYVYRYRHNHR